MDTNEMLRAAFNVNTSVATLNTLSEVQNWRVRANVAQNVNVSFEILSALAFDEDENVRANVARNNATPLELLVILSSDSFESVKLGVVDNQKTPAWLVAEIMCSLTADNLKGFLNRKSALKWVDLFVEEHIPIDTLLSVLSSDAFCEAKDNGEARVLADTVNKSKYNISEKQMLNNILGENTYKSFKIIKNAPLRQGKETFNF